MGLGPIRRSITHTPLSQPLAAALGWRPRATRLGLLAKTLVTASAPRRLAAALVPSVSLVKAIRQRQPLAAHLVICTLARRPLAASKKLHRWK